MTTEGPPETAVQPALVARALHGQLRHHPWHGTVAVGGVGLVVYIHRMPTGAERAAIPHRFQGLPVSIRYLSAFLAAMESESGAEVAP